MSSGRWFRVYDSVLDDPKVQRLTDPLFRGWVNLMCLASRNGGIIPNDTETIAFSLRISEQKARALLEGLKAATLLDDVVGGMEPHNWNGRQYKSDVSTDRVKRFRERSKTVSETPPDTEQIQRQNRTEKKTASRSSAEPDGFSEWFDEYPKKIKRKEAATEYLKALAKASREELLSAARRYARANSKIEPIYIAAPPAWLRDERWTDEITNGIGRRRKPMPPDELAGQNAARAKHGYPPINEFGEEIAGGTPERTH